MVGSDLLLCSMMFPNYLSIDWKPKYENLTFFLMTYLGSLNFHTTLPKCDSYFFERKSVGGESRESKHDAVSILSIHYFDISYFLLLPKKEAG